MAATIDVKKIAVRYRNTNIYEITLNMVYGEVIAPSTTLTEYINKLYIQDHKLGDGPAITINKFKDIMQRDIDIYKNETNIFNATAFDNAITNLENSLIP